MPITRPTADQLRFNSSANGESILDYYIEACEKGGRSLPDLLSDLWDINGVLQIAYEFREDPDNPGTLQFRTDPASPWITFTFTDFSQYVLDCQAAQAAAEAAEIGAQGHENQAGDHKDNAELAQTAAEAALASMLALFSGFGDDYLGNFPNDAAADAAADNNPTTGMIYYNTTSSELRFYTGAAWEPADSVASAAAAAALAAQLAAEAARDAAQTAESNASTSETNADAAKTAAEAAQAAAEAAYDSFDDRYLGAFDTPSEPTLDNDSLPLQVGALYWNTTENEIRVYTGSQWISPVKNGSDINRFEYTATAGQTIFTGTDDNGYTLDYGANTEVVHVNNNLQIPGVDYNQIDNGTITFLSPLSLNDYVTIIVYKNVSVGASEIKKFVFTATAGQTHVTGTDDNTRVLSFTAGFVASVTRNGVSLIEGPDWQENGTGRIDFTVSLDLGDKIEILAFNGIGIAGEDAVTLNGQIGSHYLDRANHTGNTVTFDSHSNLQTTNDNLSIAVAGGMSPSTTNGASLLVQGNGVPSSGGNFTLSTGDGTGGDGLVQAHTTLRFRIGTAPIDALTFSTQRDATFHGRLAIYDSTDDDAYLTIGQDNTCEGNLTLYGDGGASTKGGRINLYNSATYDSLTDYFTLHADSGELTFASDTLGDMLRFGADRTARFSHHIECIADADKSAQIVSDSRANSSTSAYIRGVADRPNAGQNLARFQGSWGGTVVGEMKVVSGNDTTNKDEASLVFDTAAPGGTLTTGLTIDESQNVEIPNGNLYISINTSSGVSPNGAAQHLHLDSNGNTGLTVSSGSTDAGYLMFADSGDNFAGGVSYNHNNDDLHLTADSLIRLTVDASGKIGVGTQSPDSGLHIKSNSSSNIKLENDNASSAPRLDFYGGDINTIKRYTATVDAKGNTGSLWIDADPNNEIDASEIQFKVDGSLAGKFDSSGHFFVGNTNETPAQSDVEGATIRSNGNGQFSRNGGAPLMLNRMENDTNDRNYLTFYRRGTLNTAGTISATKTQVNYNTSSDYRLKENVTPMTGAIERLNALKPVNFSWKVTGQYVDGFLAHEAQEVVPNAVSGTKDGEDYQTIDHSKLVPLLTSALQEAVARIEALEAKLADRN